MLQINSMSQTSNYTNENNEYNDTLTDRTSTKRKAQSTLQDFTTPSNKTKLRYNPYKKTNKNKTPKPQPKATTRQTTINLPSIINEIYPEEHILSKIPESTRICYMNVNGLYSNQNDKIMEISAQMIEHEIDIFGITETNTHWNNGNIFRMALQRIKKN